MIDVSAAARFDESQAYLIRQSTCIFSERQLGVIGHHLLVRTDFISSTGNLPNVSVDCRKIGFLLLAPKGLSDLLLSGGNGSIHEGPYGVKSKSSLSSAIDHPVLRISPEEYSRQSKLG